MTKKVNLELEMESGLTNNAIESMFRDQFGDQLVYVESTELEE